LPRACDFDVERRRVRVAERCPPAPAPLRLSIGDVERDHVRLVETVAVDDEQIADERRGAALAVLVHVRQFREMGRQAFLDEYLPSVVRDGDHGARLEQEAYTMAPRKGSWAREVLDAYAGLTE